MPVAAPERASRPRLAPWLIEGDVIGNVAAGRGYARALVGPLLAGLLLSQVGCGNRQAVAGPGCDLTIVIEKGFLKHVSPYQPWPELDFLFDHTNGGDPRALVFGLLLVVPIVAVAEVTGLTYHNLHGVRMSFTVSGESPLVPSSAPLHWGENRVVVPESALAPLMSGTAALHIDALGTREVHLRIPTAGMDWTRVVHNITLAADGQLIVDGEVVEIPKAMAPEPAPTLGPLRGRL